MFVTTFLISIMQVDDSSIVKVAPASVSDDVEINQDSEVLLADDHPDASTFQQEPLADSIVEEPERIFLPVDTPLHLMAINEVSTKDHSPGHKFKLRVNKPVLYKGAVVIPIGTIAWGELTSAEKSGNVGKSGKLTAKLLYLELEGKQYAISGDISARGKSGKTATIVGALSLGIGGLFAKGNNAKIKAGELMTAFTAEEIDITNDE
jgi:hypothetical protein